MNHELIISKLMAEDTEWAERLRKKISEVKEDKKNILSAAEKYEQEHKQEIIEGTKKKQLLLSNGTERGLTEEEVMKNYGKFLPTVRTPILNMLYFMLRESHDPEMESIRQEYDQKYGHLLHEESYSEDVIEPKDLDEFIYGNMKHDTFQKIKKLKSLSRSENEHESFLAYRMCLKLCDRYSLDFDKIPCS